MADFEVYEFMRSKLRQCMHDSPNILALLHMLSVPKQDIVNVCEYLLSMPDIETKVGVHLDHVGSKIGVLRPLAQVPDDHLFTLYDADEIGVLWDEYTGFGEEGEDIGGYMVDEDGLDTGDRERMSDSDYRVLLKQKAEAFRSLMTDEALYAYFLVFSAPVSIDEEDILTVKIIPENDSDLSQWERWYIEHNGFKPAGIKMEITNITGALPL